MQNTKPHTIIGALKSAFPHTLPVMAGFMFLGTAYGVLMHSIGLGVGWTFLMSFLVFAGSMQYVAIALFAAPFNPINALAVTLMVNARHLFYGLSMLGKIKEAKKFKPYVIFTLCDEAFSILCATNPPAGVDSGWFMFFIAFLCRWYWILGSLCGAVLGPLITIDLKGLDFALTAMFVVTLLNQWSNKSNRASALIGIGCSLVCLLLFGPDSFMIPAMLLMLGVFALFSNKLTEGRMGP